MAEPVKKSTIAQREEATLAFWQTNKVFEQSVNKEAPQGEFRFYDGPPFATGDPHFGHILAGTIKDVLPRYKTMQGYRVPRRWGWDCHGLPIENLVEKELGLETKKAIEDYGIAKFNEKARASVLTYEHVWKEIIPRTGRWIDMDHPYKTMDPSYTEAVWWSFKQLHEKGLVEQGFKSMHLCPRCETTLSNFEVNQGYKDITDISVYVKFELVDEPGTYLLAWTTTPWTLPGNAGAAVKADATYVKAKKDGANYILLENLAEKVLKDAYEVVSKMFGKDLVGKKYKSLFTYYQPEGKVYAADFVSTEDGTGIVHIAPAFGEDDYQLSLKENIPFIQHVGTDGHFKPEVKDFAGLAVKPKDDHQSTDILVIKYLAGQGLLFAKEKIVHSYPHCWRCDTPLLNYATSSWFVAVEKIKPTLLETAQAINWSPAHIKEGRWGQWLSGARDWSISRQRFWANTIPVWRCGKCKKEVVVGSIDELKKLSGTRDAPEFRELRNYVGEDVNLFFYPRVDCDLTAIKIEHVAPRDFYCVDVVSGKATFELNKGSFESLVKVCAPNDSACRAASGAPASTGSSSSGSGNTTTVPTSGNALPQVSRQWCEQADSGDVCEALNDESIGGQNNYKEACCHYYQKCC
jgi:isoleucyl-tRNA synthetase